MGIPELGILHSSIDGVIGGQQQPVVSEGLPENLQAPEVPDILNLDAIVRKHVHLVLNCNRGNKLKTARQLGISRSTLYRMLDEESAPSRYRNF